MSIDHPATPTPEPTLPELTLQHDRAVVIGALAGVALLCWSWIVPMALDMNGTMTGPSVWMMTGRWDLPHVLLLFAMWTVMMAGMMLPSAAPTLLLYASVARRGPDRAAARQRIYVLTAGYLGIWVLFSAAATLVQRALGALLILSPMMRLENRAVSGAVLLLAGVYQLTPLKQQCLISCRSPLSFIMQHWRPGTRGAFRLGIMHGWYCLGCCWALMLLLFAGGVMNLVVIAALTIFVLLEKLLPFGVYASRISGAALVGLGVWMFV